MDATEATRAAMRCERCTRAVPCVAFVSHVREYTGQSTGRQEQRGVWKHTGKSWRDTQGLSGTGRTTHRAGMRGTVIRKRLVGEGELAHDWSPQSRG